MADEFKVPSMPAINATIDGFGNWLGEIERYLQELDKIEPKLEVAEAAYGEITPLMKAIVMIPGSGEFVYDTMHVETNGFSQKLDHLGEPSGVIEPGYWSNDNRIAGDDETDVIVSLDQLQEVYPELTHLSLVVSWFGTDLRAGECLVQPGAENTADYSSDTINDPSNQLDGTYPKYGKISRPYTWQVAGLEYPQAHQISEAPLLPVGQLAYGGTPSDQSVTRLIQELNRRKISVTFYPFILMDVPFENGLPDPYGDTEQALYPWRGRITCHPAPGQPGTVDGTATARTQIEAFVAQFRPFILHYAQLCADAGGVEAFLIGSELRGLTWVRDENDAHPFVDALVTLAADVKAITGSGTKVSYASDWSEFTPYQTPDGNLAFHLDKLWMSPDIDAIGIDNYWPLSDWRGVSGIDEDEYPNIYDPVYLASNIEGGEGYDFFYANQDDRINQVRTPITDGLGKPWVYRFKDIRNWWLSEHFNRTGAVESSVATEWVPQSKPIWFTEIGCPAIDKGTNQPNVFVDPKSSESFWPYFSIGTQDDLIQRRLIAAMLSWYQSEERNPQSSIYDGSMVDPDRIYVYTWDARPYPTFPHQRVIHPVTGEDLGPHWGDADNWFLGHWVTGRPGVFEQPDTPIEGSEIELMPVKPMPKGEPAVNPKTGELHPSMHHYLAQIEQIAKRLKGLQIVAITDGARE